MTEGIDGVLANPLSPAVLKVIDGIVNTGFGKGLNIYGPSVMISLNGIDDNIGVRKRFLNRVGDVQGVFSHFFVGV